MSGRLSALAAGVLWSLAGVFIKSLDLHPITLVFYRSLFAAALFVPALGRRTAPDLSGPVLLSAASYTAAITAFVWSNRMTTAANAIVLQYTAPLFVFVLRRCLGRGGAAPADRLALPLAMGGLAIIFFGSAGEAELAGVLVAILSGFLFALYMVNLESLASFPPARLMLWNNVACCLFLLPILGEWRLSRDELLPLALMGVVQLGLPYFLFSKAVAKIPVQEASLIVLVEPVLNPVWVAMVVGERPSPATLAGGAIILLSLVVRYLEALGLRAQNRPIR